MEPSPPHYVQGSQQLIERRKHVQAVVLKESVVAFINATIISMLVVFYNFIRFGATATVSRYSVSISLFAVVMFVSIFGTLVPMTRKTENDPAIATGPFISITNDIIGSAQVHGNYRIIILNFVSEKCV